MVRAERRQEWQIPGPKELLVEQFPEIRDLIERQVQELLATLAQERSAK